MKKQTQETFNFKWSNFPTDDDKSSVRAKERIQRNGWTVDEFEEWIDGKRVLDAGCGTGWYTHILSDYNDSGEVYGIDIAEDAIRESDTNSHQGLIVGNINKLPFRDGVFDYVSCEEVIHHTPDPEETLNHLVTKLKEEGIFTMYVYKQKPLLREMADTTIRKKTVEMGMDECLEFSQKMTEMGKQLHEIDETIDVPDIPILDIEGGEYSLHEFVYRHFVKCYFDWETEDEEISTLTNFDWYRPEYAYRYTEDEVRRLVDEAGLEIEHLTELISGYSVRATKRIE